MVSVIITAGGSSTRFEGKNKLLIDINNKPVISHCVDLFDSLTYVDEIVISAHPSLIDLLKKIFDKNSKVKIVKGGKTRQESVYEGLKACNNPDYVIIHDGARPFITSDTVDFCLTKAKEVGAAIVAVKTVDTIKIVDDNGLIVSTPDRSLLYNAQTPQIFKYETILSLHKKYLNENYTDDALLFEKENLPVAIVEGKYSNFKITTVDDLKKI